MITGVDFSILSYSQMNDLEILDQYHIYGIATNENNECIALSSQSWVNRGSLCNNCNFKCSQGGIIWTREDYRSQGIFTELFFWTRDQAEITKTYISKSGPFHALLAEKYGLYVPKDIETLPEPDPQSQSYENILILVDKITNLIQNNGGSI